MKLRSMLFAFLMLVSISPPSKGAANQYTLYKGGYWETLGTSSNEDGHAMCTMMTMGADRRLFIKWTLESGMFVQISKIGWQVPPGAKIAFNLEFFDNERPGQTATLKTENGWYRTNKKDSIASLFVEVADDAAVEFLQAIGDADKIVIKFPEGDEPNWSVKMDGSRKAVNTFKNCISLIQQKQHNTTQP